VVAVPGRLNSFGCQAHGVVEKVMEGHRLSEVLSLLSSFLKLAVHSLQGYSLMQEPFLVSCAADCLTSPCRRILSTLLH